MVKDMGKDKKNKSKHSKPSKETESAEDDVVPGGKEELELIMVSSDNQLIICQLIKYPQ